MSDFTEKYPGAGVLFVYWCMFCAILMTWDHLARLFPAVFFWIDASFVVLITPALALRDGVSLFWYVKFYSILIPMWFIMAWRRAYTPPKPNATDGNIFLRIDEKARAWCQRWLRDKFWVSQTFYVLCVLNLVEPAFAEWAGIAGSDDELSRDDAGNVQNAICGLLLAAAVPWPRDWYIDQEHGRYELTMQCNAGWPTMFTTWLLAFACEVYDGAAARGFMILLPPWLYTCVVLRRPGLYVQSRMNTVSLWFMFRGPVDWALGPVDKEVARLSWEGSTGVEVWAWVNLALGIMYLSWFVYDMRRRLREGKPAAPLGSAPVSAADDTDVEKPLPRALSLSVAGAGTEQQAIVEQKRTDDSDSSE